MSRPVEPPLSPADEPERLARVALGRLGEPGDPRIARQLQQLGAVRLYRELCEDDPRLDLAADAAARRDGLDPAAELERAARRGIRFLVPGDPEWPDGLADLDHVQDLHRRGVRRLMVEGGGTVLTQFLTADLADELHLVVAPIFVGDSRARRFVCDGRFPWNPHHRAELLETRSIGDVALLKYALSDRCSARSADPVPLASLFPSPPAHVA